MSRNSTVMPARLKVQLMAAGIPAAKHTADALAEFFPPEFNVRATGMTAEEMARVLLYFTGRKLFSAPGATAPTSIRKVGPGWHFCQFYKDDQQLLEIIAPYVAEGLANGEACLWVFPKRVTSVDAGAALSALGVPVEKHLASGQLEMLSHPEWYLDEAGQLKSFEKIAQALLSKQDRALARGYKFLRAAGDTGWVSGTQQSREFIDYEEKINAALGSTKVAAICTYRADVTAEEFIAIVTAHQDALASEEAG